MEAKGYKAQLEISKGEILEKDSLTEFNKELSHIIWCAFMYGKKGGEETIW